ncbi:MAG TPA: hypothetical protein VED66_00635 [Candidatus Sulfotelmatobacter sp.]|nr:hypothetical protein [Candidatus Sulfotelmatobacter sp.]
MKHLSRCSLVLAALTLLAWAFIPVPSPAQTATKTDQWIHVRVESKNDGGETVRVNVPVDMAVKVLPAIKHEPLHDGKVHIECAHLDDVDLHAMLEAVRSAKDGEYVTVQDHEDDVRIAKNGGYLYIHVTEKKPAAKTNPKDGASKESQVKPTSPKESKVEIKVPMKVVDALLSAGKDELDIVAALHALSANGDTELVSVKDSENTVRIWIDSKNISD